MFVGGEIGSSRLSILSIDISSETWLYICTLAEAPL